MPSFPIILGAIAVICIVTSTRAHRIAARKKLRRWNLVIAVPLVGFWILVAMQAVREMN